MSERRRQIEAESRRAEDHVVRWLKLRGWKVQAERFKTPEGEVDIIARKKEIIAFVEVKQREKISTIEDILTASNIARVMEAAEIWIERNFDTLGTDFEIRFDLAVIEGRLSPLSRVQYTPNAFGGF
jgi:putative endonuclease